MRGHEAERLVCLLAQDRHAGPSLRMLHLVSALHAYNRACTLVPLHVPAYQLVHPVEFLIDTGASMTSVSEELAEQAGLQGQRSITMHTAAGAVEAKLSEADIELKGMGRFERLQVVILPTRDTTAMVGMNVLGKLHIQQQEGQLRLKAATSSDASR